DVATREQPFTFDLPLQQTDGYWFVQLSPDAGRLAAFNGSNADRDVNTVLLYYIAARKQVGIFQFPKRSTRVRSVSVVFSPDGKLLATGANCWQTANCWFLIFF